MKIKNKNSDFVTVEFSTDEYKAFIELMKLRSGVKDYKGGKWMPKSLYPQKDESVKIRSRDFKIVVCVSMVWCISFAFLLFMFMT